MRVDKANRWGHSTRSLFLSISYPPSFLVDVSQSFAALLSLVLPATAARLHQYNRVGACKHVKGWTTLRDRQSAQA
jgi:hypothetical protein